MAGGRREMEAEQLDKLRALLAEIIPANSFYASRLQAAGVTPQIESLEEFARRAPFTSKVEVIDDQLALPPFGTNLTYPLSRYTHFSQTSGTSGRPMRWLDTQESWSWMLDNWTRVFETAGVTPGDRVFFAFSFGPFLGFWTAFNAASRMGCLAIPSGGMRSAARLAVMMDLSATVLCCTPTYAIHLAEVAKEEGIDLGASQVRTILVAGEPGGSIPATRARIENLWRGARVVDHHGMTEIGPVSYGCPGRRGVLHVIESAFIAEVIDRTTSQPVGPGGAGELILTNLGRTGSPLLRYRTGDVVQRAAADRCECGSFELALEGGILGRTDDMVVVRGVNVYPSAVEEILRSCAGVAEYRVRISESRSLVELSIEAEPDAAHENDPALAHHLETAFRDALALRIPVKVVARGTLPRFEMKARRWVKELG